MIVQTKRWLEVGEIILTFVCCIVIILAPNMITSMPSRKALSKSFAIMISTTTADYIRETGEVLPLDSRLSQLLMGKNRLNEQFINPGPGNPIGRKIDKEGFFIDSYKHRLSVEVKDNEVIVRNSDGEVLATSNIRDDSEMGSDLKKRRNERSREEELIGRQNVENEPSGCTLEH